MPDTGQVTILSIPAEMGKVQAALLLNRAQERHGDDHDLVMVLVAPGRWREVRERIWEALGERPWEPENVGPHGAQDGDYIRRAYGSL